MLLTFALLCSVSDRETIYTGLPFAIPFMVGGVLHIAVWWTGKRPAHASGRRPMSGTRLSVLRRTTLVISLVPGTVLLAAFLGVSLRVIGQEVGQPLTYPFYLVFWGGVFLLIAGCASQSHLFGGLLCLLISAGALIWVSSPYDSATFPAWAAVPFFLTVLAGGVLHLIIWWNERQARDSWTHASMR